MAKFLLVAVGLVLAGCAILSPVPDWYLSPTYDITIRWERGSGKGYLDPAGVCHVFMVDTKVGVTHGVDEQVEACAKEQQKRSMGPIQTTHSGEHKRIKIFKLASPKEVIGKASDLGYREKVSVCAEDKAMALLIGVPRCQIAGGRAIYNYESGLCVVLYSPMVITYGGGSKRPYSSLGHEIKHCFDGDFHDKAGNWRESSPR